jgi:hypothetical protein
VSSVFNTSGGESQGAIGVIDSTNSTTTPLNTDITFTGTSIEVKDYSIVCVKVYAEPSNADGTLYIEFSSDGTNWDDSHPVTIVDPTGEETQNFPIQDRYFRVRYTNGSTANQTTLRLSTRFHSHQSTPPHHHLDETVKTHSLAQLVRAVIAGFDTNGNAANVGINDRGSLNVALTDPLSAFGDLQTAELVPDIQLRFHMGLNTNLASKVEHGSATVTFDGQANLASGTTTSSIGQLISNDVIHYAAGQGIECRYTTGYDNIAANTEMFHGAFTEGNGFGYGYNGTVFGIWHLSGGNPEIRTLTVSSAPTTSGTITIALNGGSGVEVEVLDTDDIGEVITKICAADFSDENGGWRVKNGGNKAIFRAITVEARDEAYSFTDTDTTGTAASFAQILAATDHVTKTHIPTTSWNLDNADNTATLPQMDWSKGNVFSIVFPWLGYGSPLFRVKKPGGEFVDVHCLEYEGTNTTPSLKNPDLSLCAMVDNKGTTSNVSLYTPCMSAFTMGAKQDLGVPFAYKNSKSTVGSTDTPIFVLRVKEVVNGFENQIRAIFRTLGFGNNSTNRTASYSIYKNPGLLGTASWTDLSSNSVFEVDVAATGIAGGQLLFTTLEGALSGKPFKLDNLRASPGDMFAFVASTTSGTADLDMSVGGHEDW